MIDHMMSVNHKLKISNSPWISSQRIFVTVTTKMGRLIHICLQYIYMNLYLDGTNYSNAKQLFVIVIVLAFMDRLDMRDNIVLLSRLKVTFRARVLDLFMDRLDMSVEICSLLLP